jgi:hypothetical protein
MDKVKQTFTRLAQSSEPLADEDDQEEAPAPEPAGRQQKQRPIRSKLPQKATDAAQD